jgi:acyl-CoA thioesterase-1
MTRVTRTKRTLLALGIAILIVSFGCMVLFSESLNIKAKPANLIHVACIGDSITAGSGYPVHLQAMLNSDTPYMNQSAFQEAKAFQPSIAVIMMGTNDAHEATYESIESFQADYKKLISAYQELESNPQIWLVTPPPIFENELDLSAMTLEQGLVLQIKQIADELNLPMIDVNTALINCPEYFGDGVHPNSEGAILIACEINQAITFDGVKDATPYMQHIF